MSAGAAVVGAARALPLARLGLLGPLAALALSACGGTARLAVSVETQFRDPVDAAEVTVVGRPVAGTTDAAGTAELPGLRPGVYRLVVSAHGYYTATRRARLDSRRDAVVELTYRPPAGTYDFFDSGPDRLDWTQAVITASSVTTTEYDWICAPGAGRRLVGHWQTFSVAPPAAVAPDTIAPGWVRRPAPVTHPPPPPSDCTAPASSGGGRPATPPWWA